MEERFSAPFGSRGFGAEMSRIGKKPIILPAGVKIDKTNEVVRVEGPKGKLQMNLPSGTDIQMDDSSLSVIPPDGKAGAAAYGLTRSLISNMVTGVSSGFERTLEINGVGYRVAVQGRNLNFSLGYSHPVEFELPEGMTAEVDKQTVLTLKGIDKEQLGSVAASIRQLRGPEPYKGKGIKYSDERIVRKAGKTGK